MNKLVLYEMFTSFYNPDLINTLYIYICINKLFSAVEASTQKKFKDILKHLLKCVYILNKNVFGS